MKKRKTNKKQLFAALGLGAILLVGFSSYYWQSQVKSPKITNMANLVEARKTFVDSVKPSVEQQLFLDKNWLEIQHYFSSSKTAKERYTLLKSIQSFVDTKKILQSQDSKNQFRPILMKYLQREVEDVKSLDNKGQVLAIRLMGRMGSPRLESPEYKVLVQWLESKKVLLKKSALLALRMARPVPSLWMKKIKIAVTKGSIENSRVAMEHISSMIDFANRKILLQYVERNISSLESANQAFFCKILFMFPKNIENPQKLANWILEKKGRDWEDVVVSIVENTQFQFVSEKIFNQKHKEFSNQFLKQRANKVLSLYAVKKQDAR